MAEPINSAAHALSGAAAEPPASEELAAARQRALRDLLDEQKSGARISALDAQVAKLERIAQWCRPRLSRDEYRDALDRYLKEPPTEPDTTPIVQSEATAPAWVPTHRHYKGGLYRELRRGIDAENGPNNGRAMVGYENEAGEFYTLPVEVFDGNANVDYVDMGDAQIPLATRRYAPLTPAEAAAAAQEPTDPPWITWEGGVNPFPGPRVEYRMRNGEEGEDDASNLDWTHGREAMWEIVAYRIVREGGHGG